MNKNVQPPRTGYLSCKGRSPEFRLAAAAPSGSSPGRTRYRCRPRRYRRPGSRSRTELRANRWSLTWWWLFVTGQKKFVTVGRFFDTFFLPSLFAVICLSFFFMFFFLKSKHFLYKNHFFCLHKKHWIYVIDT